MVNFYSHKKIIIAILIGAAIIASGFLFSHRASINKVQSAKQEASLAQNIQEITETDSNGNTIPDWEERLYGLDPSKDGVKNKQVIDTKRAALNIESSALQTETPLNETEVFSREFFSAVQALQEVDNLTPETIAALSVALTKDMAADAEKKYATAYTSASMHVTKSDDPATVKKYLLALGAVAKKYQKQDIGIEAKSINIALSESDPRPLLILDDMTLAYKQFAKETAALTVPASLANTHFALVSAADTIGNTLPDIKQMLSNSLIALPALSIYEKQSSLFTDTLQSITASY